MKFKNIKIEGFRSIVDPQAFNLDRPGLNMVQGINGAGKTTLFEALVWCLYGSNLKDTVSAKIQSWKEVQGDNFSGTSVAVDFFADNVKYRIRRSIKHGNYGDSLLVLKNDEQIQDRDKDEIQQYINNLLTMDFKTFMNSFMFGQRMTRLVESKSADKRKLFEELFDMEWIEDLRKKVVIDHDEQAVIVINQGTIIGNQKFSIGLLEDSVEEAELRLERAEEDEEERQQILTSNHQSKNLEAAEIQNQIINIKEKISKAPDIQSVEDFTDEIVKLEGLLLIEESSLDGFRHEKSRLQGKLSSKQELLDNYDGSNFLHYEKNIERVRKDMLEIVGELFEDSTDLLSEEEQDSIHSEYETTLNTYTKATEAARSASQLVRELEAEAVCPTCKRPYDDIEELELQQENAKKAEKTAISENEKAKLKFNAAGADAVLLEEYKKLNTSLRIMGDNAPEDPTVAKNALSHDIEALKDKIVVEDKGATKCSTEADVVDAEIQKLELRNKHNNIIIFNNKEIEREKEQDKSKLSILTQSLNREKQDIEKILVDMKKDFLSTPTQELESKREKLSEANKDLLSLQATLEEMEDELSVLKFWLKNVFAANGLKAYIFKAMLDELNQYTAKYGTKLGCSIRFSLDLTKVSAPFSTICSLGEMVNKEYKEFSGGQKQRLDIVLMFAMNDLLSSSTEINLLIMDEVFEGLDEQGESDVFELIWGKTENKSVYVISHSQVLNTLHSKTIELVNNNGKTILPC